MRSVNNLGKRPVSVIPLGIWQFAWFLFHGKHSRFQIVAWCQMVKHIRSSSNTRFDRNGWSRHTPSGIIPKRVPKLCVILLTVEMLPGTQKMFCQAIYMIKCYGFSSNLSVLIVSVCCYPNAFSIAIIIYRDNLVSRWCFGRVFLQSLRHFVSMMSREIAADNGQVSIKFDKYQCECMT